MFFTKPFVYLSNDWRFFVKSTWTIKPSSKFSFCLSTSERNKKFTILLLHIFLKFFMMISFPDAVSSVKILFIVFNTGFHEHINNFIKNIFTAFFDTSCMPSILMHERLSCCSNWSVIFYRLIFVCFSSKIWFWNIQFLELIFVRYSSISFFNSSFKSFLKLSKRAEHISLAISLNEPFELSKRSSVFLFNSSL